MRTGEAYETAMTAERVVLRAGTETGLAIYPPGVYGGRNESGRSISGIDKRRQQLWVA